MDGTDRRCNLGELQALPREEVFGIFIKLFESMDAISTNSEDKGHGTLLEYRD